ncbi:hypothetical protein BURMUCGD1_5253 [Burkholderia multivorans CGD1]|nr:hypothetical protein BURMUCGD1_5253 [Burkholderia multivorans CGD1]
MRTEAANARERPSGKGWRGEVESSRIGRRAGAPRASCGIASWKDGDRKRNRKKKECAHTPAERGTARLCQAVAHRAPP